MGLLKDISDVYCGASNMPVKWRMHPKTLYEIMRLDHNGGYLHMNPVGNKTLCGLPVETDVKLDGWQLWVECRACSVYASYEPVLPTSKLAFDRVGRCVKCHDTHIVLEQPE